MDEKIILNSIGGVLGLIGLGFYARGLYSSERQLNRNRRELRSLNEAESMSVVQALERAKELAEKSPNGRASVPALIHGITARGSTVARNILTKKDRSLSKQIKKDQDKDYPIMARNYYMSPFYWFGWHELNHDMEAQNFFLADVEHDDVANTIKVYPSLDTRTDLPKKYRDVQPHSLGITVMKTGLFSSLQFLGAQYFRMWQVVYEGDKVSLFGVLTYDTHTGQASIDQMAALMVTGAKDAIRTMINSDYVSEWASFIRQTFLVIGCCGVIGYTVRNIFQRMRELRLKAQAQALAVEDDRNRIAGAPPKVRQLPNGLEAEPVLVDDHMCAQCRNNRCNIVFIPCKHCYICEDCYIGQADKSLCTKCPRRIQSYLKIQIAAD